ncbi:MAG: NADH-quinone oxidoreductase subunit NuoG [Actinomycetota bacterium]|nr:NADH-quinone oxidoreductase subunit NuoG [Actinomycetota bacterium]
MADPPAEVRVTIDGVERRVPAGRLLIAAAEDNGTYIPRFCWHPRMEPVGMCRMCLVEIEGPRGKLLTTSCTTPVTDGMVVDTASAVVTKAQEGVLEFLLINHPLDCPVCDRGGECPLQDQTMAYGPGESRFVEPKRHFEKPIPISELVLLDRERCILCARCTRFSAEISGDPLIEFVERGNVTQILTFPDEPFASYFSGNTVQICPVGALTAKPYRFRARPWDLEAVESVSLVDAVHSKITIQASQNQVVRINGIDNGPTNHGWLSDKDRFILDYLGSSERVTVPLVRRNGELEESTWGDAIALVAERLGAVPGDAVGAIGGAHATNEEAYLWGRFLRTVVETPHIDAQLGDGLDPALLVGLTPRGTIDHLERAGTILLWAGDLKEELPVLYLRVRRAATMLGATLVVVHPRRTGLHDVAGHVVTYRPSDGPDVLRKLAAGQGDLAGARAALDQGPVVAIVGRTGAGEDPRLAEAVAAFAAGLPESRILPVVRRANVYGALDMGLAPGLLPGRVAVDDADARAALESAWGRPLPATAGRDTTAILEGLAAGELDVLLLHGADPVRDHPNPPLVHAALDAARFIVAFDQFISDTSHAADVVFPVEGFAESEGTVTNLEGRVQKVNRLLAGPGQTRATWAVLDDLAAAMGVALSAGSAEAIAKEMTATAPAYRGISWDLLDWGEGRSGVVVPTADGEQRLVHHPVDHGLIAGGERFALHLGRVLYDDGVRTRTAPPLAALVPQPFVAMGSRDASAMACGAGDLVTVEGEYGSITVPVVIDQTLAPGAVYVPANLEGTAALGAPASVRITPARGEGEAP